MVEKNSAPETGEGFQGPSDKSNARHDNTATSANGQLPVRGTADRHLNTLDPQASFFTFQTFDDDPKRDDKRLAQIFHGRSPNTGMPLRR